MRAFIRLFKASFTWLALCALVGCAQLEPRAELPVEFAVPVSQAEDGPLDRLITPAEAQHPGQSAFRLVSEGPEAFIARVRSAELAVRSLDVQTYIWHADDTGMLLAQVLLEAADRGVKVRLLIDDMDGRSRNADMAAMAAHPHIDVRMFNPFVSRWGGIHKVSEGLMNFSRLNRRMHNKSWIADNRIAFVGGRNIGDEYFNASTETNFVDLDFAMIGPVVRDASASFDKYWNSPSAYPIELLDPTAVSSTELQKLREALSLSAQAASKGRYAEALRSNSTLKRLISGDWPMEWSAEYAFISDDPLKVTMDKEGDMARTQVVTALLKEVDVLQSDLTIISPYFLPSDKLTGILIETAQTGKRVRVLTNSLAANDVAAVHGGYSRRRKPLLTGGVQLWEFKPAAVKQVDASLLGSSGASLHTKALSMDGLGLFVGSFNLDPRSTWLNCEQGVLVKNAKLASQLNGLFAEHIASDRSWSLTLEDKHLNWSDGNESFGSDPQASFWRRFQAWFARILYLEPQL